MRIMAGFVSGHPPEFAAGFLHVPLGAILEFMEKSILPQDGALVHE
jgi:hypothetical protein